MRLHSLKGSCMQTYVVLCCGSAAANALVIKRFFWKNEMAFKWKGENRIVRYFILRQHPFFSERFRLNDWQDKINPKWLCFQNFYKTPRRSVFTATMGENVPFPDIVTTPFLLLSNFYKIGEYSDPKIGISAIRISKNPKFPGLFNQWWGGGVEHYGYLEVREQVILYGENGYSLRFPYVVL